MEFQVSLIDKPIHKLSSDREFNIHLSGNITQIVTSGKHGLIDREKKMHMLVRLEKTSMSTIIRLICTNRTPR